MNIFNKTKLFKSLLPLGVLLLLVTPFISTKKADAAVNAGFSLSPASQTVTAGDDITLNLVLNAGGNAVSAWKASLTYSTTAFSSVSVSTHPSSPFTLKPSNDVASGGVIKIARYSTTPSSTGGNMATITLRSKGTGSTAVNFSHICSNTYDTTPCSAVTGSGGTNLLATITGGSYTINAVPVAAASTATKAKKKTSSVVDTVADVVNALIAPTTSAASKADTAGTNVVQVTVFDQNSEAVKGAKVFLAGAYGDTDQYGDVTLTGLAAGKSEGKVTYKKTDYSYTLVVKSGSSLGAPQIARVDIKVSYPSPLINLAKIVALLGLLGFIAFKIYNKRDKIGKSLDDIINHGGTGNSSKSADSHAATTKSSTTNSSHSNMTPGSVIQPTNSGNRYH